MSLREIHGDDCETCAAEGTAEVLRAPCAMDVKAAMGVSIDARGIQAVIDSGVRPYPDPPAVLLAICRLTDSANVAVPLWYAMDVHRLIRTLMEHGLTGWQSPEPEGPA